MPTKHVAADTVLVLARVHVPPGVKVTVPVGVVGPDATSIAAAKQPVAWLTATGEVQLTTVKVACREEDGFTVKMKVVGVVVVPRGLPAT